MIKTADIGLIYGSSELSIRRTWKNNTEITYYTHDKDDKVISTKIELTLQEVRELTAVLASIIKNTQEKEQ